MVLKKHALLLSMLKNVVLLNTEKHLFEIEIFCNFINIFTVTFD